MQPHDLLATERRRLSRRGFLTASGVGLLGAALPSLLASCSSSTGSGSSATSVTWGFSEAILPLDGKNLGAATIAATRLGLESLVSYDHDGKLLPQLAESWWSPDPVTLTYKLRKGVRFWNGDPLTADDVVYTTTQHMDPKFKSSQAFYYSSVASVKATASDEVTVKLKKPDNSTHDTLAITGIVQRKYWEAHKASIGTSGTLTMGTGPYKFTNYTPDQGVTLVRNEDYWGTKPHIKNLSLQIIIDSSTLLLAARSGDIDGVFGVPGDQLREWQSVPDARLMFTTDLGVTFLALDTSTKPWDDVHVRRAVAYCVDRSGLIKASLSGHGKPAAAVVAPEQWLVLTDQSKIEAVYSALPSYAFDIPKAKSELAQSSVPGGFSATLEYPDDEPALEQAALNLSQNLKQIGVNLNVEKVSGTQWNNDLFSGKKHIQIAHFTPDIPDTANLPTALLKSDSFVNMAKYKNASVDSLLATQASSTDDSARVDALQQVLSIAGDDVPYVPVLYTQLPVMVRNNLIYTGLGPWYMYQGFARNLT